MASKFFEHFVAITDAINGRGGTGLWDDEDGFYYDQLKLNDKVVPLKVRSLVGLIPLLAVEVLDDQLIQSLPGFKKRMDWFLEHRPDLNALSLYYCTRCRAMVPVEGCWRSRHVTGLRVCCGMCSMRMSFSPLYGIRSLSKVHQEHPYVLRLDGHQYEVRLRARRIHYGIVRRQQ